MEIDLEIEREESVGNHLVSGEIIKYHTDEGVFWDLENVRVFRPKRKVSYDGKSPFLSRPIKPSPRIEKAFWEAYRRKNSY